MLQRGRKSTASLSVVLSELETVRRPEPLLELSDEQAEEWRLVVSALPADWFPQETHQILAQYCRHVVRARRLAQLLDTAELNEEFDVKEYRDLLRSEEEQSRAMSSLATRMRITQQATYDKTRKKTQILTKKPWEG